MTTTTTPAINTLTQSTQRKVAKLSQSRFTLSLFLLVLQVLATIPFFTTYIFLIIIFNVPTIAGLVACTFQVKSADLKTQKLTKLLLKVGIAKAVGSILLAAYIALKFLTITAEGDFQKKIALKTYALYLGGSALVDIVYIIMGSVVIKKTRQIIRNLRKIRRETKKVQKAYILKSASDSSMSSSCGSGSEEELSEKSSRNEF